MVLCASLGRDVEDISRVLADVPDWKGLAGSLNIRSYDIETNCAQDVAQASYACHRRELVRRYCDRQLSESPSKVAEDIAEALEHMNHKLQAQQLRNLSRWLQTQQSNWLHDTRCQGSIYKHTCGGEFLLVSSSAVDKMTYYSSKHCIGGLGNIPQKRF